MDRAEKDPSSLPRRIGWFTASCVLVSNVVGIGIFTTTGFMARDLGHPWWILFIWLMGGLIALAGALSYSELGTALPVAGGEYVYLHRAYGPLIGFLSGWTSFAVGFSAAIAAGAMSFATYMNQLLVLDGDQGLRSTAIALGLLWSITAFHVVGKGTGGLLQRTLTVANMGAIVTLIPAYFCQTSATGDTPVNAILLQSLWASVLILSGSFERLVIYSGTVLTLFSALAVGTVVILRRKEPDLPRPYRTPLYPVVPGFFILMSMVIIWNAVSERPWEAGFGLATVLAGIPLYVIWKRFGSNRKC